MALSARKEEILKRALIALALANLCFLKLWIELFTLASPTFAYFRPSAPDWHLTAALIADILLVALCLFGGLVLLHSRKRPPRLLGYLLIGGASLFALNEIAQLIAHEIGKRSPAVPDWAVQLAIWLLMAAGLFYLRGRAFGVGSKALLISSPLFFILVVNVLWLDRGPVLRKVGAGHASGMLRHPRTTARRVFWIIFDEMDQRLAFDTRPSRVHLPNFDRLVTTSFYATSTKPPGPETLYSMPALICGRRIAAVKLHAAELDVRFQGAKRFVNWGAQPNIFGRVRSAGWNTGLSGWYNPYCRLIGRDLSSCYWTGLGGLGALFAEAHLRDQSFFAKTLYLADWQARSIPILPSLLSADSQPGRKRLMKERQAYDYQTILAHGLLMIKNPDISLILLHFPIPHPPGFWDARSGHFSNYMGPNYFDNLELADRTLGLIRHALEAEGEWDRATLLVSADHPLRSELWRGWSFWDQELTKATGDRESRYVPFILKLPGQTHQLTYTNQFDALLSQELLWQLLNQQVTTPAEVSTWLSQHSS